MISGFDVDQKKLVRGLADVMMKKGLLKPPEWARFVKTSPAKDRPPEQNDWWFLRGSSILRRMYMNRKPMGVNRIRRIYGDKEKNRYSGQHFRPASGAITRKILQQLEGAELIKSVKVKNHAGRVITPKGIALVDSVAKDLK